MKISVDVEKMLNILEQHGIEIEIPGSSKKKYRRVDKILSASLSKWLNIKQEDDIPEAPIEITFDKFAEKYGYAEAVNAYIIRKMEEHGIIQNRATFWVYEQYITLCESNNVTPLFNKLYFSKVVSRAFHYWIQDIKREGKKYRVFRKVRN